MVEVTIYEPSTKLSFWRCELHSLLVFNKTQHMMSFANSAPMNAEDIKLQYYGN